MSRETAQVCVGGITFAMGLQTRYWLDSVIYREGTWEREDAAFALSLLRPGGQAVDLGANAGFYTLAFARAVGPAGRVLAVEPASEASARLEENVRRNGLENVRLVRAAVGAAPGSLTLHLSAVDLGSSSCVNVPSPFEAAGTERVPATTLDDLVAQAGMAPDLVKIDVEGMELQVIQGAARLLAERRPALMVEINAAALRAAATEPAALVAQLQAHGYELRTAAGLRVGEADLPNAGWYNVFALPAQARRAPPSKARAAG
jgi:FkbM family methyltransferase